MQCRHTLPDWHRYVSPAVEALPIFAACRLLVKEGELSRDPRSIACAYWGRQRECPLYDGPGGPARTQIGISTRSPSTDTPVEADVVWPVRPPGARDGMRIVMIGLGVLSILLLGWIGLLGLSSLSAQAPTSGYVYATLGVAGLSVFTHILTTLWVWARR